MLHLFTCWDSLFYDKNKQFSNIQTTHLQYRTSQCETFLSCKILANVIALFYLNLIELYQIEDLFIYLLQRYGKVCWYHEIRSHYLDKIVARSWKSEIEDDFTRHIREIRLSPQKNYILITIHS